MYDTENIYCNNIMNLKIYFCEIFIELCYNDEKYVCWKNDELKNFKTFLLIFGFSFEKNLNSMNMKNDLW